MEEYRQTGPKKRRGANSFWHVWSPLFLKWGIAFIVSMAGMFVLVGGYVAGHEDLVLKALDDENQMMKIYNQIIDLYLQYSTLIEGMAAICTIPFLTWMFHRDRMKEKMAGKAPVKKATLGYYIPAILISVAASIALNNLIVIGNFASYSSGYTETMSAFYSANFLLQIVVLALIIPICEELVFRGLVFNRLKEDGSVIGAIIYSSLIFGLLHGNMVQIVYGSLLGLLLAWLYQQMGSIWAPILAHIFMNLVSVLATKFDFYGSLAKDIRYIGGATILLAAFGSCMYLALQQLSEKNK